MKKLTLIACITLICLGLSACNTVKGMGQDMTTAADSMCIYCH